MRVGPLVLIGVSLVGCVQAEQTDADPFSPAGTYKGPASLVGTGGDAPVVSARDDTVLLATSSLSVSSNCELQLAPPDTIGVDDHTGDDDVERAFGEVQTVIAGQTCTLQTSAGEITVVVSDGVVTSWRASPVGSIDASFTGVLAGGGSVTYRFSGAE